MTSTMLAARLHAINEPMQIETLPIPQPRATDVLVRSQGLQCGAQSGQRGNELS
jgi:D-arabinose 1-dehydrogenase-like Zn-dependent alcohol dehydrogenase